MTRTLLCTTVAALTLGLATAALAQPGMTSFSTTSATQPAPPLPTSSDPIPPNAPDMQAVLDAQQALGAKPIEKLSPAQARRQPTPADAVKVVMKREGMSTAPDPSVSTRTLSYGADPMETARIYKPVAAKGTGPLPVIVYYHGGGWVIADVQAYDATPRFWPCS